MSSRSFRPSAVNRGACDRDQPETPFAAILASLIKRTPGARQVALVDSEGETVDYAGAGDPYGLRVAAAHWRIVLELARGQKALSHPTMSLSIRAQNASYSIHSMAEGYALMIRFTRRAGVVVRPRALGECLARIGLEAGWPSSERAPWYSVEVSVDLSGRPLELQSAGHSEGIELLGRCADGLGVREVGWRVRFGPGIEATLVREPGGFWYVDESWDSSPSSRLSTGDTSRGSHTRSTNSLTERRL